MRTFADGFASRCLLARLARHALLGLDALRVQRLRDLQQRLRWCLQVRVEFQ